MKLEKLKYPLIVVSVLFLSLILSTPQIVYGASYVKGQSLVAEDQEKASKGFKFPGLDITWLDFENDIIRAFSTMPNQFSEGIFTLNMSSKTVSFDTSGEIISVGDYAGVMRFSDGMALVSKQLPRAEKDSSGFRVGPPEFIYGYIDNKGNEVIPLGKLNGLNSDFHEGFAVIGESYQKKGFINKAGEIIIPQIYLNAGDFSEGLAPVQSTDTKLWGYIDKTGKLVIPMEYEAAKSFSDGVAYVGKNGLAGYIDKTGKTVLDFKYKTEDENRADRSFYNGLAVALDHSGKYGYIDKTGDFVIPAKYKAAAPFKGDVTIVTSENQAYINGYGSTFLINRQGERITPLWHYGHYYGESMEAGLIRVIYPYGSGSNQTISMLNKYGAEIIPSPLNINNISPFNEGYALLVCFGKDGDPAIGLVKRPENIEEKKSGKLIKVFIDGKQLNFTDTDPIIESSRTLVPMRAIFESLGAEVYWDQTNHIASGKKDGTAVSLKIGEDKGYINDKAVALDAPAKIQDARTLVPLRFIAESFSAEVRWDEATRSVVINTKK